MIVHFWRLFYYLRYFPGRTVVDVVAAKRCKDGKYFPF
jgi:hypothetical protein